MRITYWSASALVFAAPLAAQKINPTNQINWPLSTGSGAPTSACTAVNYGQPYLDIVSNKTYVCGSSGWTTGSAGGVASINGVVGAFNFTGAVSCSLTTCTFGGGSGGIEPGVVAQIPFYSFASGGNYQISGDQFFSDNAVVTFQGGLQYTGNGGSFTAVNGGGYTFATNNASFTPPSAASQISLTTTLNRLSTPTTNAGNINATTNDTVGNSGSSNINISAKTVNDGTTTNAGNVNINSFGSGQSTNSGFINIVTEGGDLDLTAGDADMNFTAGGVRDGSFNFIGLNSGNFSINDAGGNFITNTGNFQIDNSGDTDISGSFTMPTLAGTATNCVYTDAVGLFHTTGAACGSGGGGGFGGSGTVGKIPIFVTNTTTLGNSHLDETTNAGFDTFTQGLIISDGSGIGGGVSGTEGTVASPGAGVDTFYADSTAHRWKQNPNNTGALIVPGVATAGTPADCVKFASNGIDLVDFGAGCGVTSVPGTPTHTADAGAGTTGSLVVTFLTGANDNAGYVNLTTGNSPAANSGVITINYGGTFAAARKCVVTASSALAQALGANGLFVPGSTSTVLKFDLTIGATALPANTTGYQWSWSCQN